MTLTERILNCYAAANSVKYLPKKSAADGKHIHIPKPVSHSVQNAQDNFLGLCLTTEKVLEQCSALFPQKDLLIKGIERWGATNFSYRKYKQKGKNFSEIKDPRAFYEAKNEVLSNINDRMFCGEHEHFFSAFEDYIRRESQSDYHNVSRLLMILNSCKSTQGKKLRLLKEYSNCTFLDDDKTEMLRDIAESTATNQEFLLHIDVSMYLLKKINRIWFDTICQYYGIFNPGVKTLKIDKKQIAEAKKHFPRAAHPTSRIKSISGLDHLSISR